MTTPAPPPCTPACGGGGGTPTTVTQGPGAVVTGDPAAGYVVSVPPSSDPDNLLRPGSDGNLSVTCTDLTACGIGDTIVTAGPGVIVTGNGDPGTPYEVSALSADAGQVLVEGADGGILLDCAAVAACVPAGGDTVVTAGPGVILTGDGSPATPYDVSALSADAGQILVEGSDGGVLLDCDTVTGGSTWPHPCPVDTSGQRAYCAPDGSLRLPPEKFYDAMELRLISVPGTEPLASVAPVDATYHQIGTDVTQTFTNPSDCLPMRINVSAALEHAALTTADAPIVDTVFETRVVLTGDVNDTLSPHQIWRFDSPGDPNSNYVGDVMGSDLVRTYTLPPGGSVDVALSAWIQNRTDQGSAGVNEVSNMWHAVHVWGGNL